MTHYAIREEERREFGRQVLTLWSGAFASQHEGHAVELPRHDGFMVYPEYGDSVRVTCPAPRDDANYMAVDHALNVALGTQFEAVIPELEKLGITYSPTSYIHQDGEIGSESMMEKFNIDDFGPEMGAHVEQGKIWITSIRNHDTLEFWSLPPEEAAKQISAIMEKFCKDLAPSV